MTPRYWAPYGGLPVTVLQFTDQALVNGQHIDADVFPGTRDELTSILGAAGPSQPPAPALSPDSIPTMQLGQTGDAISHLQDWCNRMYESYSQLPVTGLYGPMTQAVVAEFQRREGIVGGDGSTVGPQTKAALWAAGYRP